MKPLFWSACTFVAIAGIAVRAPEPPEAVLVFTGDIRGYLSPCGCTKPQVGGLKRLAGVVRALLKQPGTFYVDLGNWTKGEGRQEELKAEALAELFAQLKPSYLNVGPLDAKLGAAYLRTLNEATGGRLHSANLDLQGVVPGRTGEAVGGKLWVQGVAPAGPPLPLGEGWGEGPWRAPQAANRAARKPEEVVGSQSPYKRVLLFAGGQKEAERVAEACPDAGLIIFSLKGDPPKEPKRVGRSLLVTVGDQARFVGRIELVNGKWENFALIELGPEHPDDKAAAEIYRSYLHRVSAENLLGSLPRVSGEVKYAGNITCMPCHLVEHAIWAKSSHSRAYATLQKSGNERDPECVGCHVVGLTDTSGFIDSVSTPGLTDVGCESCHGPGERHNRDPSVKLGIAGQASCLSCHVPDHSPGFDFKAYWEKIKH